jgi:hypothetical protein
MLSETSTTRSRINMAKVHKMKNEYTENHDNYKGERDKGMLKKKIIYGTLLVLYGVGMCVCGVVIGKTNS